jgi:hypothetical protein
MDLPVFFIKTNSFGTRRLGELPLILARPFGVASQSAV